MLLIKDRWVWDSWLADDGENYHLFYLSAPRSLGDERLRHRNARIDHAVSTDLCDWTFVGTALEHGKPGDIDETATWTGNVVRDDDGLWWMFYTGSRFLGPHPELANIETITVATSPDLRTWTKQDLALSADPRWYERLGDSSWPEEAWRDPWVFRAPDGGWSMLITARAASGPADRGVIGLAHSENLREWTVLPPASTPGAGFMHTEVPQLVEIAGKYALVFSAPTAALSADRRLAKVMGGIWSVPAASPEGPFDLHNARLLHEQSRYSGRVVVDRSGKPQLLSFVNYEDGGFVGAIADPIEIRMTETGHLELA